MTLQSSPLTLAVLLLLGLCAAAFYTYVLIREKSTARHLTWGQWTMLWALRIVVGLLVLFTFTQPAYEYAREQRRLPVLPVLVDESLSMDFPTDRNNPLVRSAPPSGRTRYRAAEAAVQKLQERLSTTHRVKIYTFSDALRLLRELPYRGKADGLTDAQASRDAAPMGQAEVFADHPNPTGGYSNVGDALADVLRELAEEKISGVVLLSDGRQTGGQDLARVGEQAAAAHVPVHAVTFGTEFPLRDLRIDEVIVGAEASLGDVLTFHVKITNQIASPLATKLSLFEEGQPVGTPRQITLPRGQHMVSISMIPRTEGLRKFRLELPVEPDEVNTDNNVAEVAVKVIKRTLKVLLIAGHPSREYYYMVPALLRDPIIDLSCFLQSAEVDYTHQGNSTIERVPRTVKEWQDYDVAILYDVDPNPITTQQLAGLEAMVSHGGGLMVIAGREQGLAKLVQVHTARIRGLLPVEVDKNLHLDHDFYYGTPFHIQRTIKGKGHPIFLSSTDPTLNEQEWKSFEDLDFYWYHPILSAKPKSIVLATREGPDDGHDRTLMAIHRYADGAVFFSAIDSMWRWRYPYETYDYDRFWTRVIRYLGEARLMGTQQQVALSTDRRTYSPGEDVELTLRVLDPALMVQLGGQPVFASVTSEDKDKQMVPIRPDPKGESFYRGLYRARRTGTLVAAVRQMAPEATSAAKPLFDVETSFQVQLQSLEQMDTSADLAAMKKLADETGGKYFDYHTIGNVESLVGDIPADPQISRPLVTWRFNRTWQMLLSFLGCFLLLVIPEWCLRKWWGLL